MKIYMEENLDMPLGNVLTIMQDSIMYKTSYHGIKTLKNPLDSWIYQEIIFETMPDVIVEIGNKCGGSALYFAHICDQIGKGRVIGIDLTHEFIHEKAKLHPRITFIEGDACQCFGLVKKQISVNESVLVIEDSAHTYDNTLNILRCYAFLLKPGDYIIVEDSICHHGLTVGPKPGPYEAIETFIHENHEFKIDRDRERFVITWNPKGYLKRIY